MPIYYLNILNGDGLTEDKEGTDAPDLDAARAEAVAGIRSILRDEIGRGRIDLDGRIEIYDAAGTLAMTVPFDQAVEINSPS